jgi:hypothetical protein
MIGLILAGLLFFFQNTHDTYSSGKSFSFTLSQENTIYKGIILHITVPHDNRNKVMCAGINDAKSYQDFPQSWSQWACWNTNLAELPDVGDMFDQTFWPVAKPGTYYAGAVSFQKEGPPVVLPLVEFEVR